MDTRLDALVIGGGAAGLSAALMLGRARRRTLVLDGGSPRNRFAAHMHGVLGHDGLDPAELLERGRREVAGYGVEVRTGDVVRIDDAEATDGGAPDGIVATLADGSRIAARVAILATGITDALPPIPGLAERWGQTVLHCPYCHGWEVRDQRIGVVTTSPMGLHQAELVRQWSDDVTVFSAALGTLEPDVEERMRARGIRLVPSPVEAALGDGAAIAAVRTVDGAETPIDAIFTAGALQPHDAAVAHLDLARADGPVGSFIAVDRLGATSHPRIFAAGNVVDPMANVPVAMAAGAMTGAGVNASLVGLDAAEAVAAERAFSDAPQPVADPEAFWEHRYGTSRRWSGRPNPAMVDVVAGLAPGRALDVGCGEGGDVLWLAEQGWAVTGVDISTTAIRRARAEADRRGLDEEQVRLEAADVATWDDGQERDLVTASFLQSPVRLDRASVLRRLAAHVAPGGHLLVVLHAAPPSWADVEGGHAAHMHEQGEPMRSPDEEVAALALGDGWTTVVAERRTRSLAAPDGSAGTIDDAVVLLRRA